STFSILASICFSISARSGSIVELTVGVLVTGLISCEVPVVVFTCANSTALQTEISATKQNFFISIQFYFPVQVLFSNNKFMGIDKTSGSNYKYTTHAKNISVDRFFVLTHPLG